MAEYDLICVGGIGEGSQSVKSHDFFTRDMPDRFHVIDMPWQDSYGAVGGPLSGDGYVDNVHAAANDLVELVNSRSNPVILYGYSGGASVTSLALPFVSAVAAVFVANPARNRRDGNKPWWGITGERHISSGEVNYHPSMLSANSLPETVIFDVANDKDVIPCCPETQPMRDFYGLTKQFSLVDPIQWGLDAMNYVTSAMLGGGNPPRSALDYWLALAYCRGYLFDGQHTTYYANILPSVGSTVAELFA